MMLCRAASTSCVAPTPVAASARMAAATARASSPAPMTVRTNATLAPATTPSCRLASGAVLSPLICRSMLSTAAPADAAGKTKVPVDLVQKVRRRTLAGVMDCRDALQETGLDVEKAVALLIERGKQAQGRDGREAAEGALTAGSCGPRAFLLELNSETDFVGKSATFKDLISRMRTAALKAITDNSLAIDNTNHTVDLAAVGALPTTAEGTTSTVAEAISLLTSQVGEALRLRKARGISVDNGAVGTYVHNGRVAALVGVSAPGAPALSAKQSETLHRLADALAVQAVGFGAHFIEEVPEGWIDKQRQLHEQKDAETPGGIGKFSDKAAVAQAVLMEQRLGEPYNRPIRNVLAAVADEIGVPSLKITHLLKEQLGEGIKSA